MSTAHRLPLLVRRSARQGLYFALVAAAFAIPLLGDTSALGEATSRDLASQYIDEFSRLVRAEANLEVLQSVGSQLEERSLLWSPPGDGSAMDGSTRRELAALLTTNVETLRTRLDDFGTKTVADHLRKLRSDWSDVRARRNQWDAIRADLQSSGATNLWLALVNTDTRWFWLSGAIAVASLAFVSWHDRRHEARRALYGAKARTYGMTRALKGLLYLSIALALVAFFGAGYIARFFAAETMDEMVRSKVDMLAEIDQIAQRRGDVETALKAAQEAYKSKRDRWLAAEQDTTLRDQWAGLEEKARHALINLSELEATQRSLRDDTEELKKLEGIIRANQADVAAIKRLKWVVSGGIGVVLSAGSLCLGILLLATIQRRDNRIRNTCPMCLGRNTLERDPGVNGDLPMVRCNGRISNTHDCPFNFRPYYQKLNKIYFPTLGIPSAGKTHWLAMVYRELNAGRYVKNVQFEKVESDSTQQFDDLVHNIIHSRINPSGTQTAELPYPLIFDFCDNDRWGKSNLLVSVFDYGGEVTTSSGLDDAFRRRALKADGYLFFLDPTASRDIQEEGLNKFRRDLRVIGEIGASQSIQAPVALCMSKIDLLPKTNAPSDFTDYFYRELGEIDPDGQTISMKIIQARSELTRKVRDIIWPGWNIERLIHDLFGGRYMFFPMTPISLDNPDHLAPEDLQNRQIDPFGILEPLLWLLHMNGYPVVDEE